MDTPIPPLAFQRDATDPAARLRVAFALVASLVILAWGVALIGLPVRFARLQTVCETDPCAAGAFVGEKGQFGPDGARRLQQQGLSLPLYAGILTALDVVRVAVGLGLASWLVLRRTGRETTRWMAIFLAIFFVSFAISIPLDALAATWPVWRWPATAQHALGGTVLFTLFFYLFPNGRFVPGWTRGLAAVLVASQVALLLLTGSRFDIALRFPAANLVAQLAWWITGLGAQLYRYRHVSGALERQQTKVVVSGFVVMVGTVLGAAGFMALVPAAREYGSLAGIAVQALVNVSLLIIPVTIAFALLRYRLWDLDLVINRALVYLALTACISALYVLVVGTLGALLHARSNLLISLVAAGVVAVLFQPLRERLQRGVNRLLYGERDEPYAVLARLGRRLAETMAPDAVLPAIVGTVREAMKVPYVAITLDRDGAAVLDASTGTPVAGSLAVPLVHRGEHVGRLHVGPRAVGEPFTAADRGLLDQLARQAGAAIYGVRLTADLLHLTTELQGARERLVLAREEERRQLRGDLHDELAPTLAALALTAATAGDLIARDPDRAHTLVTELRTSIRGAVGDVRRLAHDLRPPTLDELGLVAAIRERAAQYNAFAGPARTAAGPGGLRVAVEAPEHLPPLPAAVEVAAYRIVQEALLNVDRHARARDCHISLALHGTGTETRELVVEVLDDGDGIPEHRGAGVGLHSMRERAAELGGACTIERRQPAGTRVTARLPVSQESTHASATRPDR